MLSPSPISSSFGQLTQMFDDSSDSLSSLFGIPFTFSAIILPCVIAILLWHIFPSSDTRKLPRINPSPWFDLLDLEAKAQFTKDANGLMSKASQLWPQKPYRIMTDTGEMVLLPPRAINEMRNEPNLNFAKVFSENFHGHLPGFDGFAFGGRDDDLMQKVIKRKLTKRLNLITKPLSDECNFAMDKTLGNSTEWHTVEMKGHILDIVARLSSRVFLGAKICRDPAWLEITKMYTLYGFGSAATLRSFPRFLRPVVHWFLPGCKILRRQMADARVMIQGAMDERRAAREMGVQPCHDDNDAIDWLEEEHEAGADPYDPVAAQLGLSAAAIHTTTDLCHEVILRIAENPELLDALREEIVPLLRVDDGGDGGDGGVWKKTTLNSMHLLDSVIKETQRLRPITTATMHRVATDDVTLPDGTMRLRKGDLCVTGTAHMQNDRDVYGENAGEFDGWRFLRMRSEGAYPHHHLVSTSPEHLGFGHGLHACPGRFFAANEIKIIMCHLLLKYDWEIKPGYARRYIYHGFTIVLDTEAAEIRIRRRREDTEDCAVL